ncbi:hypothetical protein [Actinoplanes subglobosus]|uniref:Uncharacterized protein n=1 Tax=Actinoplanes subglobosus TaxID=1547892 RepID=A0ABV8J163_9ACTN
MRRIIVLTCAVPLLAAAAALTGGAAATGGRVPEPAASPPLGDEYYTPTELNRGLFDAADLPAGYTRLDGAAAGYPGVLDTDACSVVGYSELNGASAIQTTAVRRAFRAEDGSTLAFQLLAVGPDAVAGWVAYTADPPTKCPVVTEDGYTIRNSRLPLPGVAEPAAGMIRIGGTGPTATRRHSASVGWGAVVLTVEETNTSESRQDRFVEIVGSAARQVREIAAGPSVEDLRRGLLTLADLPDGFRIVADDTVEGREVFTERDCDGKIEEYGDDQLVARRTYAKGDATVSLAVGPGTDGYGLTGAMSRRVRECADGVAEAPSISTDMHVGGIVYQDRPPRLRGVTLYREVISDIQVTMAGGVDLAAAEEIREAALRATWKIYD